MVAEVVFRPTAKSELSDIISYYESQKIGLGILFLNVIDSIFARIADAPLQFPIVYKQTRKAMVKDFPYNVYFRLHKKQLVILAILHQKRNPKLWKRRV